MKQINQIYVDGEFVSPHSRETFDLISPLTNLKTGTVVLGDETDAGIAIAAAKEAFKTFRYTSVDERIEYLEKLHAAVSKREEELVLAMVEEYGAPLQFCRASTRNAIESFTNMAEVLRTFEFQRTVGQSLVRLESLGVVGIITPWNASNSFICNKFGTALAAGRSPGKRPRARPGIRLRPRQDRDQAGDDAGAAGFLRGPGIPGWAGQ